MCSVTANESSFTLQWYYSNSSFNAGHSGDILNNIGENHVVRSDEDQIENGTFITLSHLTIINVTANEFGYYRCMVRLKNSGTLLPNSSTILHLSNFCASGSVCNSSLLLYRHWSIDSCANHDNKKIVFPETLPCIRPTSNVASIRPNRTMPLPATLPLQTITGKSTSVVIRATGLESEAKTYNMKLPSPSSTVVYTEPLPTGVVSDGAQNVTGSDNVIRTSDIEEEVKTSVVHSMKLPSPHSTVKAFPTDVVSDGDSDTQLNWLYVGIAMAIVLTAIALILILIICICYKKRRGGGQSGKVGSRSLLLSTFATVVLSPQHNS